MTPYVNVRTDRGTAGLPFREGQLERTVLSLIDLMGTFGVWWIQWPRQTPNPARAVVGKQVACLVARDTFTDAVVARALADALGAADVTRLRLVGGS